MPNADLARAASQIEPAIRSFCRTRLQTNPLFFMADLTRYVNSYPGLTCAPASPDRILRKMQSDGKLKYLVVNRSKSLYRINEVQ